MRGVSDLPPGSDAALDAGCTCAVIDNRRGRGQPDGKGGLLFHVSGDCPMHGGSADGPRVYLHKKVQKSK